jgi:hypothetical protein
MLVAAQHVDEGADVGGEEREGVAGRGLRADGKRVHLQETEGEEREREKAEGRARRSAGAAAGRGNLALLLLAPPLVRREVLIGALQPPPDIFQLLRLVCDGFVILQRGATGRVKQRET